MKKIHISATKIVFVMLAATACYAYITGKMESKDFMVLTMSAFSFYFAIKQPGKTNEKGENL